MNFVDEKAVFREVSPHYFNTKKTSAFCLQFVPVDAPCPHFIMVHNRTGYQKLALFILGAVLLFLFNYRPNTLLHEVSRVKNKSLRENF